MKLKLFQIDAFAQKPFEGNPAAVIPLEAWLEDKTLQAIAEENNLAETAFFVPMEQGFHIRWFTPTCEVKLCGHATLASAYVLFNDLGYDADVIAFQSLSGPLSVAKKDDLLVLDFPTQTLTACDTPELLCLGLGQTPSACFKAEDYLAVFDSEASLASIQPDPEYLKQLDCRGVIATAASDEYDFVLRFFAPQSGITEDAVTGSAFTKLAPYWASVLGKNSFKAKQISARSGEVYCELKGDRVLIAGHAVQYLAGDIEINSA